MQYQLLYTKALLVNSIFLSFFFHRFERYGRYGGNIRPSQNYTCHRCHKQGHFIRDCPIRGPEPGRPPYSQPRFVKVSAGIPREFMTTVQDPSIKGAKLTSSGHYAVPKIDHNAYQTIKKEKHPFLKSNSPEPEEEQIEIPEQLLCPLCSNLMTDSVLIPCCGESFCDECKLRNL